MNYIIDMDGTLYHGKVPVKFAKKFINYLQLNNKEFILATNCPEHTSYELKFKLAEMDILVEEQRILTSGQATASYLAEYMPGARIYLIGSDAFRSELIKNGLKIVETKPDFVVVGFDRSFNYKKLSKAVKCIFEGAQFIITNNDFTIPYGDFIIPHTGAIASGIEAATGIKPIVMGKPEKYMLDASLKRLVCSKDNCCIIGDRLDTDIAMGKKYGVTTYLVMTGVTSKRLLNNSEIQPDRVFNDLNELMSFEANS